MPAIEPAIPPTGPPVNVPNAPVTAGTPDLSKSDDKPPFDVLVIYFPISSKKPVPCFFECFCIILKICFLDSVSESESESDSYFIGVFLGIIYYNILRFYIP